MPKKRVGREESKSNGKKAASGTFQTRRHDWLNTLPGEIVDSSRHRATFTFHITANDSMWIRKRTGHINRRVQVKGI